MNDRAISYSRLSKKDPSGLNIPGQMAMNREYCEAAGYRLVGEFSEEDVSGAEWETPEISRILELAEAGAFDVLVVRQMDRLARGLAKQLFVERQFEQSGVRIEYVLENFDETPEGQLMKLVKGALAEYERLEIQRRMTRGKRQKLANGQIITYGKVAYGYRLVDGEMVIDEEEAEIVRRIFRWYCEGLGAIAIAARVTRLGIDSYHDKQFQELKRQRRGVWARSTIWGMIRNETYAGRWTAKTGETIEVPAIIDEETWRKSQQRRRQNYVDARRNLKYPERYLLRRMDRCGICGRTIIHVRLHKRGKDKGEAYFYYRCVATRMGFYSETCKLPSFRAEVVDALVWEWVKHLLLDDPDFERLVVAAIEDGKNGGGRDVEAEIGETERGLADLQRKREALLDLYLDGNWSRSTLDERRRAIDENILELESALVVLRSELEYDDGRWIDELRSARMELAEMVGDGDRNFGVRHEIVKALGLDVEFFAEDRDRWLIVHVGRMSARIEVPYDYRFSGGEFVS